MAICRKNIKETKGGSTTFNRYMEEFLPICSRKCIGGGSIQEVMDIDKCGYFVKLHYLAEFLFVSIRSEFRNWLFKTRNSAEGSFFSHNIENRSEVFTAEFFRKEISIATLPRPQPEAMSGPLKMKRSCQPALIRGGQRLAACRPRRPRGASFGPH